MSQVLAHTEERPFGLARQARSPVPWVSAAALAATVFLVAYLTRLVGGRHAALFVVGVAAGSVLYHASFGFTSAWRVFFSDARSAGLRAQMVMLGCAASIFIVLLSLPQPVLGVTLRGSVAPVGLAVLVGAFIFGVGMQLGGGCASGTLYSAGGGNTRMLVTLGGFVAGSLVGTLHAPFWETAPSFGPLSLLTTLGPAGALVASIAICGSVAVLSARRERHHHGHVIPISRVSAEAPSLLSGPWPLLWGALGLVAVNVATLLLAGRGWGVTSAFALWGAKLASVGGIDVASWPYWAVPARAATLQSPVLTDVTSVMDVGIMLGALAAAGFANKFAPLWRVPLRSLVAAAIGGVFLGYGARTAFGCNIGAYFSGVASTSLHGWLWFAAAFAGSAAGTRLRPLFGLTVECTLRERPRA